MKKILILAMMIISTSVASAKGVMVVDSEKIFKSLAEYNSALTSVERLSVEYQRQVDAKFAEVETLFNKYTTERNTMTATQRNDREKAILAKEKAATAFQEEHFKNDGTLMKLRLELIAPIQKKVFQAIEEYATQNDFDVVLDKASNATLLYNSAAVDRTDEIINKLK